MYFDAIVDRHLNPVFSGTREECLAFLVAEKENTAINSWTCVPGETLQLLDVDVYLTRYTPDEKAAL